MKMPCCFRRPRSRCRASERRSSAPARIRRALLMMSPLWVQESTREPWGRVGTRCPIIAIRTSQVVIIDSGGAMRTVRLSWRAAVSDSPRPSLWGALRRHRGSSSLRSATKGDRRWHDLGDAVQIKGLRDEVERPSLELRPGALDVTDRRDDDHGDFLADGPQHGAAVEPPGHVQVEQDDVERLGPLRRSAGEAS
jgi:hypothetical protein